MGKLFKWFTKALDLAGTGSTVAGALGLSATVGAVTAYAAHWANQNLYLVLLVGCGTFASLMVGLYHALMISQKFRIKRRLDYKNLRIADGGADYTKLQLTHMTVVATLENLSASDIFVKFHRCHFSVAGRTHESPRVNDKTMLLQGGREMTIGFPTVETIPAPSSLLKGAAEVEILYGSDEQSLDYVLRVHEDVQVAVNWAPKPRKGVPDVNLKLASVPEMKHLDRKNAVSA
ncbi:hypothetical protein [Bradyrhizobium sp. HKCCYLR20261]|uniref:hypothetical protein n=1 Tax=Bradyrhizobium sp. HKCCYLR20261 TaxID=3420760 RepID=UPI003EB9CA4C